MRSQTSLYVVLLFVSVVAFARGDTQGDSEPKQLQREFTRWLKSNGHDAAEYVVSKFKGHDLVILGEVHEVKENCDFVASLIGPLHAAGINVLCSEFLCSRFNEELQRIVTAPTFDESRVREMFRQGPWPTWGFKEYHAIVHAVWKHNQTLGRSAKPFRIVGVDSDWKQVEILRATSPVVRFKTIIGREDHMTKIVEQTVFDGKQKALLHIGFAHSVRQGKRLAAQLAPKYGKRVFSIALHSSLAGRNTSRLIEGAVAGASKKSVGFDTVDSPLGSTRGDGPVFKMLGPKSTFASFAQGYVLLKPQDRLTSVTWIPGFITPKSFADSREIAEGLGWVKRGQIKTPAELDKVIVERLRKR